METLSAPRSQLSAFPHECCGNYNFLDSQSFALRDQEKGKININQEHIFDRYFSTKSRLFFTFVYLSNRHKINSKYFSIKIRNYRRTLSDAVRTEFVHGEF